MVDQVSAQMVKQNISETVKNLYAEFGRGDMATVLDTLSDDIEFVLPGPADIPMSGTYRGKQAVQAWFGTLVGTLDFQIEPREFIAQGDKVVVLVTREGTVRHNGRKFAVRDAHIFTVRDGKITHHEAIEDTAAVVAAYHGE